MACLETQGINKKTVKWILGSLALIFLFRFFSLFSFDLGVDEAHYMLYARYLDFSYFDHPPLVGWTHYLFNLFFGETLLGARLPAYLAGVVTGYFLYRYLLSFFDYKVACLAVLAMNASFMLNVSFFGLIPETFLLLLIFPIIICVEHLERYPTFLNYCLLGLLLGLAGLAKYSAVLLVPPILLYFVLKKNYSKLFHPYMLITALIGLAIISPVIYWNVANNFISFSYQSDHVMGGSVEMKRFARSFVAQLAYSPLLFVLAVWGFWVTLREIVSQRNDRFLLPFLFGTSFSAFFIYTSFYSTVLPHWSSIFYVIFIPLGVCLLFQRKPKLIKSFVFISVILTLLVFLELLFKVIPFPDYQTPYRDIYGWDTITEEAFNIVQSNPSPNKAVAVTRWTKGSRAMYYYPGNEPVIVIDRRFDQFDLWQSPDLQNYDVLLMETYYRRFDQRLFHCDALEYVSDLDISLRGSKVNSVSYSWCHGYRFTPVRATE